MGEDAVGVLARRVMSQGGQLFERVDAPNVARGYWLTLERDFWGEVDLIAAWGRLGRWRVRSRATHAREVEELTSVIASCVRMRLRRGYVLSGGRDRAVTTSPPRPGPCYPEGGRNGMAAFQKGDVSGHSAAVG